MISDLPRIDHLAFALLLDGCLGTKMTIAGEADRPLFILKEKTLKQFFLGL